MNELTFFFLRPPVIRIHMMLEEDITCMKTIYEQLQVEDRR